MNLKDRGITIGDLLILIIIIATSTYIIKKINGDRQSNSTMIHEEIIDRKEISYLKKETL